MKATYFLIAIAIVMIFFMVELFDPFLKSIFVSLLLAVATSTLTLYLEKNLKSRFFATTIMTVALTSLFFIPILYCIFSFADFFTKVDQSSLIKNLNDMKIIIQDSLKDFIFLNDFLLLEKTQNENNIKIFLTNIDNEMKNLKNTTNDYSAWDDTYEFIKNKNKQYIYENFREAP